MSFLDGACRVLDGVASRLALGSVPKNALTRDEIERDAAAQLQARIDRGRPGPEEWARTRPPPAWAVPRPRATRKLEAMAVDLGAITPASPAEERRPTRADVAG